MITTFEDYLEDIHAEDYHGLDDDMSDNFDAWVADLEADNFISYGQKFADMRYRQGKIDILNKIDFTVATEIYDSDEGKFKEGEE